MTVYIEYVILDNFAFTMLICFLSFRLMREDVKVVRCIIASCIGTACAVAYPFVKGLVTVLAFKAALFVAMCIILYAKTPNFIVRAAVFLLCTALIGGIQFMVGFAVYGSAEAALKYPVSELPVSIFFIVPALLYLLLKKVLEKVNEHRLKQNYIYNLRLISGKNSICIKGLIDTGNAVKEKMPVVFVNSITAFSLLNGEFIKLLDKNDSSTLVHTAAGDKKIILFPAQIELYLSKDEHIFMDVQVGISDIKTSGEYQAILPLCILEKEKVL